MFINYYRQEQITEPDELNVVQLALNHKLVKYFVNWYYVDKSPITRVRRIRRCGREESCRIATSFQQRTLNRERG